MEGAVRYLLIPLAFAALLESRPAGVSQGPRESMVVSSAWLASHVKDDNLVLLHLGVKTDYDAGHIPGARFITLNEISVSDTTSETGLTLQMPAPDDLRTKLEALGISDATRVVVSYGRDRIAISDDTRTRFRELVRSSSTTVGSTSPSGGGTSASNCLSLQPVPEELARTHPELSSYRYLAIGDQVVLVDPQQQKIVQVID